MPLDVVQLATAIDYSNLLVLLLVLLVAFIYAIPCRQIAKFQGALSRNKPVEDGFILMETSEIGEEDKVGKVVSNSQVKYVRDDGIANEQVFW